MQATCRTARLVVRRPPPFWTASPTSDAWTCSNIAILSPPCALTLRRSMAGHSHWAKIKRSKGSNDAQRAVLFTKISVEIIAAARAAGGDLSNIRLSAALTKAKANNVPKATIDNALKKGMDDKTGANMEVVTYEGMGPGSVAVIVEALTDNRKRTAPAVRHIFSKSGGSLGTTGSVGWMFEKKGLLEVVRKEGHDASDLLEAAIEAGADDVEEEEEEEEAEAPVTDLASVQKGLESRGYTCSLVQFIHRPKQYTEVSPDDATALASMLDLFESDPDVQEVFHNAADPNA